jgi:hypothetical protein
MPIQRVFPNLPAAVNLHSVVAVMDIPALLAIFSEINHIICRAEQTVIEGRKQSVILNSKSKAMEFAKTAAIRG